MGQQEPCEIQQGQMPSPAPGKNEPLTGAWVYLAGSSSVRKACECWQTASGAEQLRALAATQASSSWAVRTGVQPGDPRKGLSPLLSPQKTTPTYLVSGEKTGVK